MLSRLKKFTGIFLVLVMALSIMPFSAAAEAVPEESFAKSLVKESENALYSVRAEKAAPALKKELQSYNIEINDDSLIELVPLGSGEGTAIRTTTVEGNLITQSSLMSVNEDGEVLALAATDLSANSGRVYPFGNSFEILFIISYYAYSYGGAQNGLIQPQTAIFQYFDRNNLYDVTQLTMDYCCQGIDGYFNGTTFTPISSGYSPIINKIRNSVTNPVKGTSYGETVPYSSNKAIQIHYNPGGQQYVDYTIVAWRNSTNKKVTFEDTLYF